MTFFTHSYMRVIFLTSTSCPFKQHLFHRLSLVKIELVEIKLHCDSIITRSYITRSPRGSQILFLYKCQQSMAVYTMQAVKIVLHVCFLARFDTS